MPMGRSQVGCRSGSGDRASALEDEGSAHDAGGITPKKACSDADEEQMRLDQMRHTSTNDTQG